MHDTLQYFQQDPIYRRYHHHELTFSLLYAFSENFILPLSHDEVVHGKGSLISKMAGDRWQKFANLRALYAYMWAHPGKKLLFMGSEIAQEAEWSHERSLDWHLLEQPAHAGIQTLVRDLNHIYRAEPALWELDSDPAGFWWLEPNDADANVLAFARASKRRRARARVRRQSVSGPPGGLPARPPAAVPLARGAEHRLDAVRRQRRGQSRWRRARPDPLARAAGVRRDHDPAARRCVSGAGRPVSPTLPWERRLGARPLGDGLCEFRVWAPRAESIALRVKGSPDVDLDGAGYGVYEVIAPAQPGDDYWFVVNGRRLPDPCSRSQPRGLRGPSRVVDFDPGARFDPPGLHALVIYELHVGTFTAPRARSRPRSHICTSSPSSASPRSRSCRWPSSPVDRGWGYDGVYISAAQSSYGGPAGLAKLVRAAHQAGLAVVLDVVYNHLGASGVRAIESFGPYFTDQYETPWGRAINYDGADCDPVREWVLQSAAGWVHELGIDGLRLDAIHAIFDSSAEHIVAAIARRVHSVSEDALVIAESGLNDPRVMRPRDRGGYACDAAWADDFHHALRTLVTDEHEGYYSEFGRVAQLAKAFHRPYVHDGQYSSFRRRRFGAPAEDVPPERFVVFSQNHDQVGNRAFGDRMPVAAQPLAALCTLLAPYMPLLFMGEEYGEKAPFQFFSDHIDKRIADATRDGRRREFAAFATFEEEIPDPQSIQTFERSKLSRERDPVIAGLYAELLAARRELPRGEPDVIEFDEEQRWLRVRRGAFELVCNFGHQPVRLSCDGDRVRIATAEDANLRDGHIKLPPLSGALII